MQNPTGYDDYCRYPSYRICLSHNLSAENDDGDRREVIVMISLCAIGSFYPCRHIGRGFAIAHTPCYVGAKDTGDRRGVIEDDPPEGEDC